MTYPDHGSMSVYLKLRPTSINNHLDRRSERRMKVTLFPPLKFPPDLRRPIRPIRMIFIMQHEPTALISLPTIMMATSSASNNDTVLTTPWGGPRPSNDDDFQLGLSRSYLVQLYGCFVAGRTRFFGESQHASCMDVDRVIVDYSTDLCALCSLVLALK